jgi:SOS-response transcriptional repressor LexA
MVKPHDQTQFLPALDWSKMARDLLEPLDTRIIVTRIRDQMKSRGTNASAVSREAHLGGTAVHDIVSGKNKNPSIPMMLAIARALHCDVGYLIGEQPMPTMGFNEDTSPIPIAGFAETGAFRQMLDFDQLEHNAPTVHAPRSTAYPLARHFALEVRGDSMNAAKPTPIVEGMFALCVDIIDAELMVESGRIYAVRRTLDGGSTWECTIKRAKVYRNRIELVPESSNVLHQKIVIMRDTDPSSHTNEVAAIGLVYGLYSSFEEPR